jgi:hypothetical protein
VVELRAGCGLLEVLIATELEAKESVGIQHYHYEPRAHLDIAAVRHRIYAHGTPDLSGSKAPA